VADRNGVHEYFRQLARLAKRERDAEIAKLVRKRMESEIDRKKEQAAQRKLKELGMCLYGRIPLDPARRWVYSVRSRCAGGYGVVIRFSIAQLGLW
jgi:hypothetical protein